MENVEAVATATEVFFAVGFGRVRGVPIVSVPARSSGEGLVALQQSWDTCPWQAGGWLVTSMVLDGRRQVFWLIDVKSRVSSNPKACVSTVKLAFLAWAFRYRLLGRTMLPGSGNLCRE